MKRGSGLSALIVLWICAPTASAQAGPRPWDPDPVVGVWQSEVTVRDCKSGAVLASFRGMQVLHAGGTLSDTNTAAPSSRGPGFGYWVREGDSIRSVFRFARFTPDGQLAGWSRVERSVALAPDGRSGTGTGLAEIETPEGLVVGTACTADTSTRAR